MSAYDKILAALEQTGVRVNAKSSKARAQCPVHNSNGQTLSIRRFEDRAKIHCFAGCEATEILAALGLALRDLYDGPGKPSAPYRPRSPLGDADHFVARIMQQEILETFPQCQERRASELIATLPQPGDHTGGPVAPW